MSILFCEKILTVFSWRDIILANIYVAALQGSIRRRIFGLHWDACRYGRWGIVMTAQMVFVLYVVEVCTVRSDVRQYRDTASNDVVFL